MDDYSKRVRDKFNNESSIWPRDNTWSNHSKESIATFIEGIFHSFDVKETDLLLNAGSAGNRYEFPEGNVIHYDIADKKLRSPNSVAGTINYSPFVDESFSHSICVGSVLNYCDPLLAIKELARVTKKNGFVLIDYDSSCSWEFIKTSNYCKAVSFVRTFYNGKPDDLYVYSSEYITAICKKNRLRIVTHHAYHLLSPLVYRATKNEWLSGCFGKLDQIAARFPLLKQRAATIILCCEKF